MHFVVLVAALFSTVVAPRDSQARVHNFAKLNHMEPRAFFDVPDEAVAEPPAIKLT